MGVSYLWNFLEGGEPEDLLRYRSKGIIIFVEEKSFLRLILEKFTGDFPLIAPGGREGEVFDYAGIRGIAYAILLILRFYNIKLEFFAEETKHLDGREEKLLWEQNRRLRDRNVWQGEDDWCNAQTAVGGSESRVWQHLENDLCKARKASAVADAVRRLPLPRQSMKQIRDLVTSLGIPYRVIALSSTPVNVCISVIVQERNDAHPSEPWNQIHSVLTYDTDYAITKGLRMLAPSSFDSSNDFKRAVLLVLTATHSSMRLDSTYSLKWEEFLPWASQNLRLGQLLCEIWSPQKTAAKLGLWQQELPSFAVLCGNAGSVPILRAKDRWNLLPQLHNPGAVTEWIRQQRPEDGMFHCLTNPICLGYCKRIPALQTIMLNAEWQYGWSSEYPELLPAVVAFFRWRRTSVSWYDDEQLPRIVASNSNSDPLNERYLAELYGRCALPEECANLLLYEKNNWFLAEPPMTHREAKSFFSAVMDLYLVFQATLGILHPITYHFFEMGCPQSKVLQASPELVRRVSVIPYMKIVIRRQALPPGAWLKELFEAQCGMPFPFDSFILTLLRVLWKLSFDGKHLVFSWEELRSFVVALIIDRHGLPTECADLPGFNLQKDIQTAIPLLPLKNFEWFQVCARNEYFYAGWRTCLVYHWIEAVFDILSKPLALLNGLCGYCATLNPSLIFTSTFRLVHSAYAHVSRNSYKLLLDKKLLLSLPRTDLERESAKTAGQPRLRMNKIYKQVVKIRNQLLQQSEVKKLLKLMPSRSG